jgi:hypothetical protein
MRWRLLFFCLICSCYSGWAQTTLHFIVADADQKVWKEHSRHRKNHPDSASSIREVERVIELLRKKTYLAASADQMHYHHDSLLVWLSIGPAYAIRLSRGNAPDEVLRDAGYRTRGNAEPFLSYQQWVQLSERILVSAENHGYPFAGVQLDSIQAEFRQMKASINFQRGPVIAFDSLLLSGTPG